MSAVDPADVRAQACAELGLLCELAQPRHIELHPHQGGSSGYPVWSREEQLEKWNAGEETVASQDYVEIIIVFVKNYVIHINYMIHVNYVIH